MTAPSSGPQNCPADAVPESAQRLTSGGGLGFNDRKTGADLQSAARDATGPGRRLPGGGPARRRMRTCSEPTSAAAASLTTSDSPGNTEGKERDLLASPKV
ncbi:hypothetical protein GCM10010274_43540 [Streptomyces lavendofoliae]|uniref:Uncharacterized protein n=1 Tax=Streptomyces lavendofoliae TaxID=67314 RepID=A0A918I1D7_9ACTN|nr:hypothetical protein GCM10010274_43540 [Streptomyces lavendofoliae]